MEATRYRTITSSMIKIMMVIMMIILVNVQADDHQEYLINIPSNTVTPDDNAHVEDQTAASPPPPNSVIGDIGRCASECAAMCGRRHVITTGSASTDRFFFPRIPGFIKPPRIRRPGRVRKPRRPGGRVGAAIGDCYKDCLLDCGLQAPSSLSQCTAGCAYNSVTATASTLLTEDNVQNYVDSCYKECQKNN